MKKREKIFVFVICFLLVIIAGGFLFFVSTDEEKIQDEIHEAQEEIIDNYESMQELHWRYIPITYQIKNECRETILGRLKLAFEKITEETDWYVKFKEVEENPDISIYCKPYEYEEYYGGGGIASAYLVTYGAALPFIPSDNKKIIKNATIHFYGPGVKCLSGYPALEVHEILHTLGFNHDYGTHSIMRPEVESSSQDCKITKIDDKITSCLKYIYSNGKKGKDCSTINLISYENLFPECEEGTYEAPGDDGFIYCCPEPNMTVVKDYCVWE